ncbi:MAG: TIR domain-containing protein [Chloroflexi bacterium]|nr:TIR domain-containing protein [Chloroflexota bacterium]
MRDKALEILGAAFQQVSAESLRQMLDAAHITEYGAQHLLCREGDPGDTLYAILEGEVEIHKNTSKGPCLVDVLRAGTLFGELALLLDRPRTANIIVPQRVIVLEIDRASFERYLKCNLEIFTSLSYRVIERMLRQEEHLLARLSLLQPEGDQTPRVFISYSHRDQNFVCQLANDLKRNRIYSWMDQREIGVGSIWSEQVELALDACEIMVVVLSPESAESPNVADEWHYYLDAEKTIVPVLYRDCHIPFRLKRIQYVDFVRHSYEDGLASLIDVLLEKLGPPGCLSVDIED